MHKRSAALLLLLLLGLVLPGPANARQRHDPYLTITHAKRVLGGPGTVAIPASQGLGGWHG